MAELLTRRVGAVGTVVVSNPEKLNAVTIEMWRALPGALEALDRDPEIRVIVLTGAGDKAFVSGGDIGGFDQPRAAGDVFKKTREGDEFYFMAPLYCAKPVIAKIRGYCMGGGLALAAACDVRICADDAQFRMPAARLGLGYGYTGLRRFIAVLGAANTADIFFSARRFGAAEALRMGYVSQAVPAAELDRAVEDYCAMVAENAPLTVMAAKRAITAALRDSQDRDLAAVQAMIDACRDSADFKEGRAAFREKRKPQFKGA